MKIPRLEPLWEEYKTHRMMKRFYPRRIVCPDQYVDPKYFGVLACSQNDTPTTPTEQLYITRALAVDGVPTYFMDGNFLQAVWHTEPKDRPPIGELNIPMRAMLLMLPTDVSRRIFLGYNMPMISYAVYDVARAKELSVYPMAGDPHTQRKVLIFYGVLLADDGKPLGYYGRVPMDGDMDESISKYPFNDNTVVEEAYIKWSLKGKPDPLMHLPDTKLPTPDEDHILPDKLFGLLYKLFLVLNATRDAVGLIWMRRGMETRSASIKHGKLKDALWSPNFIGLGYQPVREPQGGSHASPRMHWRRGHTRQQPYGPKMALRKTKWIEPMLIGIEK